ncbi:TPM domain-containing protein [Thermithiobacillus plumbiphilus]|uniref:TPM domain-containing protein n=1 Tax=Thermithiobacillus plumbiphilus TaxID=1729899 RepID=A0ABU9DC52_9PROT
MDIRRIMHHLFMSPWRLKRAFPAPARQRIEAAIARAESTHRGQIRFAVEHALDLPLLLRDMSARERAIEVFSQLRVWDTAENNGVLIYLLLADHDVEILVDRGVSEKIPQNIWEAICHEMEAAFRAGQFEAGVLRGIERTGELLAEYFPPGKAGPNELPDAPVFL